MLEEICTGEGWSARGAEEAEEQRGDGERTFMLDEGLPDKLEVAHVLLLLALPALERHASLVARLVVFIALGAMSPSTALRRALKGALRPAQGCSSVSLSASKQSRRSTHLCSCPRTLALCVWSHSLNSPASPRRGRS